VQGVRVGLYSGLLIPIPTLILPLKGRKPIFDHGAKRPLIALLLRKSICIDMTLYRFLSLDGGGGWG
jgi:hypothetical protein